MPKHLIGNWSSLLAVLKPFADSAAKAADILPKPANVAVKGVVNGAIKVVFPATTVIADSCDSKSAACTKLFGTSEEYQKKWRYKWYSLAQLALNMTSFGFDIMRYHQNDSDNDSALANASYLLVSLGVFLVAIRDITFKEVEDAANQSRLEGIRAEAVEAAEAKVAAAEAAEAAKALQAIPRSTEISITAMPSSDAGITIDNRKALLPPRETKKTQRQVEEEAIADDYKPSRWLF